MNDNWFSYDGKIGLKWTNMDSYVTRCAILYHLFNIKNVKNAFEYPF